MKGDSLKVNYFSVSTFKNVNNMVLDFISKVGNVLGNIFLIYKDFMWGKKVYF